jgi:WD40 repeat protein
MFLDDLAKCCRVGMLKAKRRKKKDRSVKKTPNHQNTATTNTDNFHKGSVLCCAISPDDKYLVTGGSDRLIK